MCLDEISTGLDAATTFEITRTMSLATHLTGTLKIVSLLQPPPETVANFDELILIHDGKVIYAGPVERVVDYFMSIGYEIPERMDVADWLQILPSKDGWQYLKRTDSQDPDVSMLKQHLSPEQFRSKFNESALGKALMQRIDVPCDVNGALIKEMASRKYQNSSLQSLRLVGSRELLLWWRDKYAIKVKLTQNIVMGLVVGTLFFQQAGKWI